MKKVDLYLVNFLVAAVFIATGCTGADDNQGNGLDTGMDADADTDVDADTDADSTRTPT